MVTRRRIVVLVLLLLVGSGGFATATALSARKAVEQPSPVERVERYYRAGPSAVYEGDSGGIGQMRPLRFETPAGETTVGVVEASFGYRTRGTGPFVVTLGVREVDGPRATVRPEQLVLAPAPRGGTATVRFLAPTLADGVTYEVHLGVNSVFPERGRNAVHTRKVVLTVELS